MRRTTRDLLSGAPIQTERNSNFSPSNSHRPNRAERRRFKAGNGNGGAGMNAAQQNGEFCGK